jgi:ATP-dependent RNA helicase DDX52/ROK1
VSLSTHRTVLQQPLRVTIGAKNTAVSSVSQRLLFVGRENGKLLALRQLLAEGLKPPVLVFVASKVCAVLWLSRKGESLHF